MLTFNTQFPINNNRKIEDLLEIIKIWLIESPHSKLNKEKLRAITAENDHSITSPTESIQIISLSQNNHQLISAKHTTTQDSIRWTTEISGSKKEFSFWISIQVSCDNSAPTHKTPNTKKPHIIKLILKHLGGGVDGDLQVSRHQKLLNSQEIEIAAEIISGKSFNLMPVIYISADENDSHNLRAEKLAYELSGMAHVLVEPNREFSFDLKHETKEKNAYGGAVAIYWPDGLGRYIFLPWGKYADPISIENEAKQVIRSALLSMRPLKDCNWQYITEQKSRAAIEALKSSGSTQIDEYITHFDAEIASLREEISKLERENLRLKSQVFPRSSQQANSITIPCNEPEIYQGEIHDLTIDAFESLSTKTPEEEKRRKDLILDILKTNSKSGSRSELIRAVKDTLSQYSKMDERTRRSLERIGFEITGDKNHYKLTFKGDHRYHIILAKTPSDFRAGMNTASDLCRILFGNH